MEQHIYSEFSTEESFKTYLWQLRWKNDICCSFCNSTKNSTIKNSFRAHCNTCNTNFSLTTRTIMQNTKIDLRKWLLAIYFYLFKPNLSYRKLADKLNVNKNTAFKINQKLNTLFNKNKIKILTITSSKKDTILILSSILIINFNGV